MHPPRRSRGAGAGTAAGRAARPGPPGPRARPPAAPRRRWRGEGGAGRGRPSPPPAAALGPAAAAFAQNALALEPGLAAGLAVNSAVFVLGIRVLLAGLTPWGVFWGWVLGTTIYAAFGAGGYALVCLYFVFGSLVTKVKLEQKQAEGIAEARSGRRSPGSVFGSGAAGIACALASLAVPGVDWRLGFVASFASKLADTTSSEIGKAYGRTTYLITSFALVPRGTEGAVSLEGTAAGVVAGALFALGALALGQVTPAGVAIVTLASLLANTFESWLGAACQGDVAWLTNDVVNAIQISLAAALAIALQAAL